jgi:hypothetical protein
MFDGMEKMKAAGDALRDKFAGAAAQSPFFKPRK